MLNIIYRYLFLSKVVLQNQHYIFVFLESYHSRTDEAVSVYDILHRPEVIVCEAISSQSTVNI
jgi:hypothetical protein